MQTRPLIRAQARANFNAQYGPAVGAYAAFFFIIYTLGIISNIISYPAKSMDIFSPSFYSYLMLTQAISMLSLILSVLVYPPVMVGHNAFSLRIYRGQTATVRGMFENGFSNYGRHIGGMLWMELFIFLWSLLFIIPGIIKYYAYFMTPYILAECPNVPATEALRLSMRMTQGYKGDIFVMQLSFLGWGILSALTFGILGLVYVGPYYSASMAGMYDALKARALTDGVVSAEELAGQQPVYMPGQ
jgi:uncharacterized membrane protein